MKSVHNDKTQVSCVECKPNKEIETNEIFECLDCELYCCETCKDSINYQDKVQQYFKFTFTFEPHQFMCIKCVKSRYKTRYEEQREYLELKKNKI